MAMCSEGRRVGGTRKKTEKPHKNRNAAHVFLLVPESAATTTLLASYWQGSYNTLLSIAQIGALVNNFAKNEGVNRNCVEASRQMALRATMNP
jgi:hypothetical protein